MVTCSGCGYLAIRQRESRALVSVEGEMRLNGAMPSNPSGSHVEFYERAPICFAMVGAPYDEFDQHSPFGPATEFVRVVMTERVCAKYTPWRQGFSPREHREAIDRESERKSTAGQIRLNLVIALVAVLIAVAGTYFSALAIQDTAHIQADLARATATATSP